MAALGLSLRLENAGLPSAAEVARRFRALDDAAHLPCGITRLSLMGYVAADIGGDVFALDATSTGEVEACLRRAAEIFGRLDGVRVLQVYWLAAREPGTPLENPRQVSAYRYPREYGPQSPTFARALLPPSPRVPLLLSGTASIVGHASQHADSLRAQLDETLTNLDSLLGAARERAPTLSPHLDGTSRLKVYVRDAADADAVAAQLEARLGTRVPWLMLHADVCRRELLVEIEGMHGVGA